MVKQWRTNFRMIGPIECTYLVTCIASNMGILDENSVPFIEDPCALIDETYLVQGHTVKKGLNDSLVFFSLGDTNEILLPNAGYHLYNCLSLTIPLVPQEESRRHSVSGLPAGLQEAGPEGRSSCSSNLSLNHSNMRLEVHHGRVPAPPSGHRRPQGTDPPVPAPADPRDVQLRLEVSPL